MATTYLRYTSVYFYKAPIDKHKTFRTRAALALRPEIRIEITKRLELTTAERPAPILNDKYPLRHDIHTLVETLDDRRS